MSDTSGGATQMKGPELARAGPIPRAGSALHACNKNVNTIYISTSITG